MKKNIFLILVIIIFIVMAYLISSKGDIITQQSDTKLNPANSLDSSLSNNKSLILSLNKSEYYTNDFVEYAITNNSSNTYTIDSAQVYYQNKDGTWQNLPDLTALTPCNNNQLDIIRAQVQINPNNFYSNRINLYGDDCTTVANFSKKVLPGTYDLQIKLRRMESVTENKTAINLSRKFNVYQNVSYSRNLSTSHYEPEDQANNNYPTIYSSQLDILDITYDNYMNGKIYFFNDSDYTISAIFGSAVFHPKDQIDNIDRSKSQTIYLSGEIPPHTKQWIDVSFNEPHKDMMFNVIIENFNAKVL